MTALTKAQISAEIASQLPNNSSGQISPLKLQRVLNDVNDSVHGNTFTQDLNNDFVAINKTTAPVDYASSVQNYAAVPAYLVQQWRNTQAQPAGGIGTGEIHSYTWSGEGKITWSGTVGSSIPTSNSIWTGHQAIINKIGSGSLQAYSAVGYLGAPGAGAYNELGLFQGAAINTGSSLGDLSIFEGYTSDSADGGATSFPSLHHPLVPIINRYNAGGEAANMIPVSGGTQPADAIIKPRMLQTNGASAGWKIPFDLSGITVTSGFVSMYPNGTTMGWESSTATQLPALSVGSDNKTYIFGQGQIVFIGNGASVWGVLDSTGLSIGANKVVGPRDTGWTAMTGTPDKASAYATGSVTLVQLAQRVKALEDVLIAHGLIGA